MKYAIFDIDGCLTDDSRRKVYLALRGYDDYHGQFPYDTLINQELLKRFANDPELHLLIITGRPRKYFAATLAQLEQRMGLTVGRFSLYMRYADDKRTSPDMKRGYLELAEIAPNDIVAAFDDRADVCAMYRDYGVKCVYQMTKHGNYKFTPREEGKTAADCLREGEALFKERNGAYKDSPQRFGRAMAALYPDGLTLNGEDDFTKFGIFLQMMSKTTRFAASNNQHLDSIRDLKVYSAMLEAQMGENDDNK